MVTVTLTEAATLMKCTPRAVRYKVQQGTLPATKQGRQWVVRVEDLPLSATQRRAVMEARGALREVVDKVLPPSAGEGKGLYSVRTMRVFAAGAEAHQRMVERWESIGSVSMSLGLAPLADLQFGLRRLCYGHYAYDPPDRRRALESAREIIAGVLADCLLLERQLVATGVDTEARQAVVEACRLLDEELLGRLGALVRATERERPRGRRGQG